MNTTFEFYDNINFQRIGDALVYMLLDSQRCAFCDLEFIGREEKDNAICAGKEPLHFAHEVCWKKRNGGIT